MITCPNCKNRSRNGARFCDKCGTQFSEVPVSFGSHSAPGDGGIAAVLSKISVNTVKITAILLVIVVILVVLLSTLTASGDNNSFSYIKDNELYYSTAAKAKGKQASTELLDGVASAGDIGDYVRIDNDGKRLFFVDKYDGTGYDLYFKNTSKLKKESVKITSDINVYDINDKGTLVTYIKDGGDLYQHDLNEQSNRIDESVMSFVASDNGKRIIYLKMSEESDSYAVDVYLSKSGKPGDKIASSISDVNYLSDDFKLMYYTKNGSFYKTKVGREPELISDGIGNVIKIYETGEAYYTGLGDSSTHLYYYDGKNKPVLVTDAFYSAEDYATDKPVLIFYSETVTDDSYDYSFYIATEEKSQKLDFDISSVDISSSGKQLYYISEVDPATGAGTLYKASISSGGISEPKKCDTNIYSGYYLSSDKFIYIKNYNATDKVGDVYINDKKIGENIHWGYINYSDRSDILVYFTDVSENNTATLNVYKGGSSKAVSDDTYMYSLTFTPKGEPLFLADFKSDDGILYICKGKKAKKVDVDVSSIISIVTNDDYDMRVLANF